MDLQTIVLLALSRLLLPSRERFYSLLGKVTHQYFDSKFKRRVVWLKKYDHYCSFLDFGFRCSHQLWISVVVFVFDSQIQPLYFLPSGSLLDSLRILLL